MAKNFLYEGKIIFGTPIDTKYIQTDAIINYYPLAKNDNYNYWTLRIGNLYWNVNSVMQPFNIKSNYMILDTGINHALIPQIDFDIILQTLKDKSGITCSDNGNNEYMCDCSSKQYDHL